MCRITVKEEYFSFHYENTPIQIYRKFHLQKGENLQIKKL